MVREFSLKKEIASIQVVLLSRDSKILSKIYTVFKFKDFVDLNNAKEF